MLNPWVQFPVRIFFSSLFFFFLSILTSLYLASKYTPMCLLLLRIWNGRQIAVPHRALRGSCRRAESRSASEKKETMQREKGKKTQEQQKKSPSSDKQRVSAVNGCALLDEGPKPLNRLFCGGKAMIIPHNGDAEEVDLTESSTNAAVSPERKSFCCEGRRDSVAHPGVDRVVENPAVLACAPSGGQAHEGDAVAHRAALAVHDDDPGGVVEERHELREGVARARCDRRPLWQRLNFRINVFLDWYSAVVSDGLHAEVDGPHAAKRVERAEQAMHEIPVRPCGDPRWFHLLRQEVPHGSLADLHHVEARLLSKLEASRRCVDHPSKDAQGSGSPQWLSQDEADAVRPAAICILDFEPMGRVWLDWKVGVVINVPRRIEGAQKERNPLRQAQPSPGLRVSASELVVLEDNGLYAIDDCGVDLRIGCEISKRLRDPAQPPRSRRFTHPEHFLSACCSFQPQSESRGRRRFGLFFSAARSLRSHDGLCFWIEFHVRCSCG